MGYANDSLIRAATNMRTALKHIDELIYESQKNCPHDESDIRRAGPALRPVEWTCVRCSKGFKKLPENCKK
jgi:hypothetical protein